jgi:predicted transcriptional regulator
MKNRSRTEIMASILDIVGNGNSKTKIMYKAYLSYAQMMGYLSILEENKLIEQQKGGKVYNVTEKGRRYLEHYKKIDEMILTDVEKK